MALKGKGGVLVVLLLLLLLAAQLASLLCQLGNCGAALL
jgi:hypothetical protein